MLRGVLVLNAKAKEANGSPSQSGFEVFTLFVTAASWVVVRGAGEAVLGQHPRAEVSYRGNRLSVRVRGFCRF